MIEVKVKGRVMRRQGFGCAKDQREQQSMWRLRNILNTDTGVVTRNSQGKEKKEGRGSAGCAGCEVEENIHAPYEKWMYARTYIFSRNL